MPLIFVVELDFAVLFLCYSSGRCPCLRQILYFFMSCFSSHHFPKAFSHPSRQERSSLSQSLHLPCLLAKLSNGKDLLHLLHLLQGFSRAESCPEGSPGFALPATFVFADAGLPHGRCRNAALALTKTGMLSESRTFCWFSLHQRCWR